MALAIETPRKETLLAKWERHYPLILSAVTFACCLLWVHNFFLIADAKRWAATTIYSATFDLASIITAFLFTFYAFVVTTDRGFISQMKRSNAYRLFKKFTLQAIALGALLTLSSVPFMVAQPEPMAASHPAVIYVAAWAALLVGTASAFVRSAMIFVVFIAHQD